MPKRRHTRSREEVIDHYKNKIRKLERKIRKLQISGSSDASDPEDIIEFDDEDIMEGGSPARPSRVRLFHWPEVQVPHTNTTPKLQIEPSGEPAILGDEPGDTDKRGPEIRNELLSQDTSLDYPGGRQIIRNAFTRRSIPKSSLDIMLASLSLNSLKQYDICLKRWWIFCKSNAIDVYGASVPNVIFFLTELFNVGCQYRTLNTCKLALSLVIGPVINNDDRLKRFLKGAFRLKPPKAK